MNKYFYPLVQNPFSNDDIKKGIDVLKSKQLTLSKQTHNFEKNFSKTLKSKYSLMVNLKGSLTPGISQKVLRILKKI